MSQSSNISANRHSLQRGERKAIRLRQNPRICQHEKHAQRQLLPTGLTFQSSLEITRGRLYEVQSPSRLQPVLHRHLTVRSIVLI
jgi:hypothetical protein